MTGINSSIGLDLSNIAYMSSEIAAITCARLWQDHRCCKRSADHDQRTRYVDKRRNASTGYHCANDQREGQGVRPTVVPRSIDFDPIRG